MHEFEASAKPQRFVGSEPESSIILLTDTPYARLQVTFGGADAVRPALEIETEDFIGVKSFKAKGKRISTYNIAEITELEPTRFPEPPADEAPVDEAPVEKNPEAPSSPSTPDQPSLFDF